MYLGITEVKPSPELIPVHDPRNIELGSFFDKYRCIKPYYEKEYIKAADKYKIPYRLLPAIWVQEGGCRGHQIDFNGYGYGSAAHLKKFQNQSEAIDWISMQLGTNKIYSQKTVWQKLRTYGPGDNPNYPNEVMDLMKQIR